MAWDGRRARERSLIENPSVCYSDSILRNVLNCLKARESARLAEEEVAAYGNTYEDEIVGLEGWKSANDSGSVENLFEKLSVFG